MMSAKTYRKVAEIIRESVEDYREDFDHQNEGVKDTIEKLAGKMADQFKIDNSAFRYATFYTACGLNAHGKIEKV